MRSKIVVVSINRRNNRAKRANRFVNLGKTVERRVRWNYLLKSSIIKDSIFSITKNI